MITAFAFPTYCQSMQASVPTSGPDKESHCSVRTVEPAETKASAAGNGALPVCFITSSNCMFSMDPMSIATQPTATVNAVTLQNYKDKTPSQSNSAGVP